jgi:hypothetical protein
MEIGDIEKKIYNLYLKALGESQNRPYTPKKDFSNLTDGVKVTLKKLAMFFDTYKDVNPTMFFRAGFKHEGKNFIELSFFTSLKASRLYSKFVREKYNNSVDNEESIKDFKDGIIFIYDFMKENDFTLTDYVNGVNDAGVPWFIVHLKKQNISFYHIHALDINIEKFPSDWRELLVEDFDEIFFGTKRNFENSMIMKKIGSKLNSFLKREKNRS